MHSPSESAEDSYIAAEAEPGEQSSASSSDSSSAETDEDPDDDSATSMDASKDSSFSCAGQEIPETSNAQQRGESHHRKGPTRRRSDAAQVSTQTRRAAGGVSSHKGPSNSASEISSASRSLELRVSQNATTLGIHNSTTVSSGPRIRPGSVTPSVFPLTAARQRRDQPANCGQEETDADLKTAIRESYAKFALNGQRLTFCSEPLTLDPTAIN